MFIFSKAEGHMVADLLKRNTFNVFKQTLREKCPNTEFFLVRIFQKKTPYLEIFLAVKYTAKDMFHTKVTYNDNDNNSE